MGPVTDNQVLRLWRIERRNASASASPAANGAGQLNDPFARWATAPPFLRETVVGLSRKKPGPIEMQCVTIVSNWTRAREHERVR